MDTTDDGERWRSMAWARNDERDAKIFYQCRSEVRRELLYGVFPSAESADGLGTRMAPHVARDVAHLGAGKMDLAPEDGPRPEDRPPFLSTADNTNPLGKPS